MVTNQEEYENIYLLTRKMICFVKSLANESKDSSDFYKYLKSLGYELDDDDNSYMDFIKLFVEKDILNCYFYLRYQKLYNHELYVLFNTIVYGFFIGDVPWAYSSYQNILYSHIDYFAKMFDNAKPSLQYPFPYLYIKLSKVDKTKAEEYIFILQKIAVSLTKYQSGKKKRIDERIDILLSNPKLFINGNDDNNESHQLEDEEVEEEDETIVDNIDNYKNEHYNMKLLKDKMFNGISFEILREEYHEGYSSPFHIILRITNFNDKKKKIGVEMKYISIDYGLKDGNLWDFGSNERFLQDNSFVDVEVSFEDIMQAKDGDRIEMIVNEGKFAFLKLIRERGQWTISESIERNSFNRELKNKIEHFEAIEEQFGITLQNFSVKVEDENALNLFCEVLALNGEVPQEGFNVEVAIYDSDNSIIYQTSLRKYDGDFKGFEVFNFGTIRLDIPVDEISKIRIYPTR